MMAPEWLQQHGGELKPGIANTICFVVIGGATQYKLEVRPAHGKFACAINQTINGKRLDDSTKTYASPTDSLAGGLEQLREKLGW